jgi:hypothetical protein
MLADVRLQTSPSNVFPIRSARLVRFHAGYWRFGTKLYATS